MWPQLVSVVYFCKYDETVSLRIYTGYSGEMIIRKNVTRNRNGQRGHQHITICTALNEVYNIKATEAVGVHQKPPDNLPRIHSRVGERKKMNFEFDARSSRLEKEQLERREDARKKREKELIIKANVQRLDEELRELNVKRKLEAEEFEIERQRLEDEERLLTGNINYKDILKALNIEGEDDRVTLPESALESLSSQDSFGKGAAVFQLTLTMAGNSLS